MVENGNKARITTGFLNTVNDVLPGSLVNNNTGVATYPGLLGKKYFFTHTQLAKRWTTATSALPTGDMEVQYYKAAAVTIALGELLYWSDKDAKVVTNVDTTNFPFAGVALSAVSSGQCGYMAKVGRPKTKFLASTTKVTPDIGDIAWGISGNTGFADVLADATALTNGSKADNREVGKLATVVTSQFASVDICVND